MPMPPRLLTVAGVTKPLRQWAAEAGLSPDTVRARIDEFGWPPERALAEPAKAKHRPGRGGRPRADAPRPCPAPRDKGGQAVCEWKHGGRRHQRRFGPWGSVEAAANYRRFAAAWAEHGPAGAADAGPGGAAVADLLLRWLAHCDRTYVKRGAPTGEPGQCRHAARPLNRLYGDRPAATFGPVELQAVRREFVGLGWSRPTVNARVGRIVRCWKWGVSQGLVPVASWQALTTVAGLKRGRGVPDRPRRRPPDPADVARLLAWLDAAAWPRAGTLAALVRVQSHTGCRPGELCRLEAAHLARPPDGGLWRWAMPGDKGEHLDRGEKAGYLGARSQAVLAPLLARHPAGPAFRWPRGGAVTVGAYGEALRKGCERAGVSPFTPHQLRHLLATTVAAHYGSLDHAAAALGDTPGMAAAVYVHLDPREKLKMDVARELG